MRFIDLREARALVKEIEGATSALEKAVARARKCAERTEELRATAADSKRKGSGANNTQRKSDEDKIASAKEEAQAAAAEVKLLRQQLASLVEEGNTLLETVANGLSAASDNIAQIRSGAARIKSAGGHIRRAADKAEESHRNLMELKKALQQALNRAGDARADGKEAEGFVRRATSDRSKSTRRWPPTYPNEYVYPVPPSTYYAPSPLLYNSQNRTRIPMEELYQTPAYSPVPTSPVSAKQQPPPRLGRGQASPDEGGLESILSPSYTGWTPSMADTPSLDQYLASEQAKFASHMATIPEPRLGEYGWANAKLAGPTLHEISSYNAYLG